MTMSVMIPGGHWFARMKDPDHEGKERLAPVLAWVLRDGTLPISDRMVGLIAEPVTPAVELIRANAHPLFIGWAYLPATEFEAGILALYSGSPIDIFGGQAAPA